MPLELVETTLDDIEEATLVATDLQSLLIANKENFALLCGGETDSLDNLESILGETILAFDEIIVIGNNATDLLSCQDINQIWIDVAHDAVCTSAPTALAWMFSTMSAIFIGGMIIFLLRGALLPTIKEDYFNLDYHFGRG